MKFTLDSTGVDHINQGIGSIFQALAKGDLVRQEAEQTSALRNAQTYNANMSGNKHGAEAERERYTLERRKAVPDLIAADPNMPAYLQAAYKVFDLTGDTNMDRFAKASQTFQSTGYTDRAAENLRDPNEMNKFISIASGKTYEPYANVGTSGYSLNKATGAQTEQNPVLAKLYDQKVSSEIGENKAQAYNASMSGNLTKEKLGRIQAGGSANPLTAAQLRENQAIEEARAAIQSLPQDKYNAVMNNNPAMMTAEERNLFNIIQKAAKPKYGETDVPAITPLPAPPAPAAEPGAVQRFMEWLTKPDPRPPQKEALLKNSKTQPPANKMTAAQQKTLQDAKDAISSGAPREKVMERLKAKGIDTTGL